MNSVLIIGLGSIAKRHIANIKILFPKATIVVVSSSGRKPTQDLGPVVFCKNISQALTYSPNFAIIASPATFHYLHAKVMLEAKIPVLIEKPITANLDEAIQLLNLAQEKQVPIKIGYCLPYLPSAKIIKNLLSEHKIGSIYNVHAHVGQYLPNWRQDKNYKDSVSASAHLGGGALLELSHELDYLHWLLGPLKYNFSVLRRTQELALDVEEIADILLTNEQGTVCSVHLNFIQKNTQRYCYFIGEKGDLHWDLITNTIHFYSEQGREVLYNESSWDKNNMYLLMIESFVEQINQKKMGEEPLMNACETIRLIDQIKKEAIWGTIQ
ncbi:Gfo/Idh/MocA family protein [Legionella sp. km772]|uniref:Gfo/Idh/MocA family protein n=1 Tax=Legionella sp. km772 TaxID=2498111 RepID=UPI000F8EB2B3|nr:Gfo/Idh/MocA family oxidoreductase [Legionella sp. km772]RUR12114.1 Gfo/Idh/MocA family oxidoreductase [Legionella sp. km772]